MTNSTDHPGVVGRPPLLYAGTFVVALILQWLRPLPILRQMLGLGLGISLFVLGAAFITWGRRTMQGAGTNIDPTQPTTALALGGPFVFTRNPLYVGLTVLYLGLTLAANTWWGVIVLAPLLIVMHFGVVLREERYLSRKFGSAYAEYRGRVRRYF